MNDRFKFRNWDEHEECMVYDMDEWEVSWLDSDHTMQCTGLKDKNGKLIYEGDIISHPYLGNTIVTPLQWFRCDAFDCYGYSAPSGFFYDNYYGTPPNGSRFLSRVQIIGNIYENPELLK